MHRVCCPLLLFFSFFPLVGADLFHDDGILVQPPQQAKVIVARWTATVLIPRPAPLPLQVWVGAIRSAIQQGYTWTDPEDRRVWEKRLRRLLTNGDARNVTRSRRGLIDVVGHLSKTLFGTATSRDINKVRRLINMLGNRQEEIVHHVTNLWTLVNKTRSYVRENREDIGTLQQQVRDVRLALSRHFSVLTKEIKTVRFAQAVDRSLTELELIKEQSRQNWREYQSTIRELQHEQLSSRLLPSSVVAQIRQALLQTGYEGLSDFWYYRNAKTFLLRSSRIGLLFVTHLPVVSRSRYLRYKLQYFPIAYNGDTLWRQVKGRPTILVGTTDAYASYPTDCIEDVPVVCKTSVFRKGLCEQGLVDNATAYNCPIIMSNSSSSPLLFRLNNREVILSTQRPVSVTQRCEDRPPTVSRISRISYFTLPERCSLHGPGWIVPAHREFSDTLTYAMPQIPVILPALNVSWPEELPEPIRKTLQYSHRVEIPLMDALTWRTRPVDLSSNRTSWFVSIGTILFVLISVGCTVYFVRSVYRKRCCKIPVLDAVFPDDVPAARYDVPDARLMYPMPLRTYPPMPPVTSKCPFPLQSLT